MKTCDVTRDLLPLYMDSSCSEDSREFVDAHLAECEACRAVHDAASKTVQTVLTGKRVKKSFGQFRRKTRMKRSLLILLCVVLGLTVLGVALYQPAMLYLHDFLPCRIEPIEASVSRLSDGSLYLSLRYTEEDVFVSHAGAWNDSNEDGTLALYMHHTRLYDMIKPDLNAGYTHSFIIITEESDGLYNPQTSSELWRTDQPYTDPPYSKVILVGSDGERVLWQEGDDIPDADEQDERYLQKLIDDGFLIPISGQP